MESRPRWMSSCAGSSSSSSASATAGSTTPESELTTEVHRPEEAVAPGSLEPAAAEVEASLAAAHATRRREGGEAAEGRRARGRRGRRPRQHGRRGRSRWWRRGGRGTCGCTRDARGARTRTRTRTRTRQRRRRGGRRGARREAPRGAPRAGEWRGGTPRRRGVLGAPRDARPLGGSSPPRAPRRRGGARGRAPRRRAASRSRRGPPSCRSTYPSGHVPPRGGMDERGRRRGERRRGVNARPSRFDLFRRGKRAPPVILLGECPGKSGVRGGASAIIAIARSLEPGRRDRSCCHLGGSGSGECRGYFWARANLANLSTQE